VVHRQRRRAVGLIFATWLTRMTELAWPLQTGNMPIVAWWPNLIIMFELTMLVRHPRGGPHAARHRAAAGPRPALYDPEIMDGKILVGVVNPANASAVERALSQPGAEIRRSGN
jgi:hypothetical protein